MSILERLNPLRVIRAADSVSRLQDLGDKLREDQKEMARQLRAISRQLERLDETFSRKLEQLDQTLKRQEDVIASVPALHTEVQQCLTSYKTDARHADRLPALRVSLGDSNRLAAHAAAAVARTPLQLDPFPHVVIENLLPEDAADELVGALPSSVFFKKNAMRHQLQVPFVFAPAYSRLVWSIFFEKVITETLLPALTEKFRPALDDFVRTHWPHLRSMAAARHRASRRQFAIDAAAAGIRHQAPSRSTMGLPDLPRLPSQAHRRRVVRDADLPAAERTPGDAQFTALGRAIRVRTGQGRSRRAEHGARVPEFDRRPRRVDSRRRTTRYRAVSLSSALQRRRGHEAELDRQSRRRRAVILGFRTWHGVLVAETIPLVDLKAQYRALKPEIDQAMQHVLDNAQFILGPAVTSFENDFAAFCHTTEAIGVNSGTSALHLSLLAAGVGRGDEVITVPFTFVATVAAIEYAGARPVFVDVEPTYSRWIRRGLKGR